MTRSDLQAYREVEALLDRELEACRSELHSAGFRITDNSNRPGWRGEYPFWSHNFDVERRAGTLVELVRVHMYYGQSFVASIRIDRSCERFRIGAHGPKRAHTRVIAPVELESGSLFRIIVEDAGLSQVELAALGAV